MQNGHQNHLEVVETKLEYFQKAFEKHDFEDSSRFSKVEKQLDDVEDGQHQLFLLFSKLETKIDSSLKAAAYIFAGLVAVFEIAIRVFM